MTEDLLVIYNDLWSQQFYVHTFMHKRKTVIKNNIDGRVTDIMCARKKKEQRTYMCVV
jgi:hypothetical protein